MPGSLPPGIATADASFGIYTDPVGNLDLSVKVTVTISDELIWAATGDVIEIIDVPVTLGPDGRGLVTLPIIQSGFVNAAGAAITAWTYTAKWSSSRFNNKRDKPFTLTSTDASPVDIDRKPQAGIAAPQLNPPVPYVNTVTIAGGSPMSGNVVIPASSGGGGGSGATTVQGITDATLLGKSLLLSADATAAKRQMALDLVDNTRDLDKPISTAVQQAISQLVSSNTFQQALLGLVTTAALTQALAGKLDASTAVMRYARKINGTWQPRPVTAVDVPVLWLSPDGSNPPGGGTVGGKAGMVDGTDVVALGGG